MGVNRVKTERSVAYIDHNTLQTGFENADDHRYHRNRRRQSTASVLREPGNGICHQVHLERFAKPGETLAGLRQPHPHRRRGIGIARHAARAGWTSRWPWAAARIISPCPRSCACVLTGALTRWVSAKDVILELLRRLHRQGRRGQGDGVRRARRRHPVRARTRHHCQHGRGAGRHARPCSPRDEVTRAFLKAQGREADLHARWPPTPDADV